ncbi:hypothetical protein [Kingella kingae]|uniref:hypothetical protein n=1 Tax=Kingella kingae TaxID=504 RepID=UPI000417E89C|nr:hypothetical protein [Kingella kingae]
MFKKSLCTILTAAVLSQSSCTTLFLWGKNPPTTHTTTYQDIGSDQVHAFGRAERDSNQLKAGSLLMMGDKYWYALDADDSTNLLPVLNAKLTNHYQIYYGDEILTAMPVVLTEKSRFSSDFCLKYTPAGSLKTQEAQTLQSLQFKPLGKQPETYARCFYTNGTLFAKPMQSPVDYRFEQVVPVKLSQEITHSKINGENLIGNILFTPIALAIDAMIGIVVLPLTIFAPMAR